MYAVHLKGQNSQKFKGYVLPCNCIEYCATAINVPFDQEL